MADSSSTAREFNLEAMYQDEPHFGALSDDMKTIFHIIKGRIGRLPTATPRKMEIQAPHIFVTIGDAEGEGKELGTWEKYRINADLSCSYVFHRGMSGNQKGRIGPHRNVEHLFMAMTQYSERILLGSSFKSLKAPEQPLEQRLDGISFL